VVLSDGSCGIVSAAGSLIDRPIIELTQDHSGKKIAAEECVKVDLSEERHRALSVVELKN
jgi:hypothetical protein